MDILNILKGIESNFESLNEQISKKQQEVTRLNQGINELVDEQKRLQGEHRLASKLAIDIGVINSDGYLIPSEDDNLTPSKKNSTVEDFQTEEGE